MTDEPGPSVDVPIPEVSQVAFVVEDLEAGMRRFGRLLGLEPWLCYRFEPPRLSATTYRGEPSDYSMRVALTDVEGPVDLSTRVVSGGTLRRFVDWLTSVRDKVVPRPAASTGDPGKSLTLPNPGLPGLAIELIEPLSGPSTYTEHLEHGDGIHHIGCYAYDDPRAVVEQYEAAGIPVIQSGRFEGVEFWYLDLTHELDGLILEIAADAWAIPAPDAVYPESSAV